MKNPFNPKKHHRRSIRLVDYDYSKEGLYFITICVQNNTCLFGHIENQKMILNDAGKMIEGEWLATKERFPNTELHEYVVMPNHFHAIVEILPIVDFHGVGQPQGIAPTLGEMVGAFKSIVSVEYIRGVKTMKWKSFNGKLLQRNYWEHIIRSWDGYLNISNYIKTNPEKWKEDKFFAQ